MEPINSEAKESEIKDLGRAEVSAEIAVLTDSEVNGGAEMKEVKECDMIDQESVNNVVTEKCEDGYDDNTMSCGSLGYGIHVDSSENKFDKCVDHLDGEDIRVNHAYFEMAYGTDNEEDHLNDRDKGYDDYIVSLGSYGYGTHDGSSDHMSVGHLGYEDLLVNHASDCEIAYGTDNDCDKGYDDYIVSLGSYGYGTHDGSSDHMSVGHFGYEDLLEMGLEDERDRERHDKFNEDLKNHDGEDDYDYWVRYFESCYASYEWACKYPWEKEIQMNSDRKFLAELHRYTREPIRIDRVELEGQRGSPVVLDGFRIRKGIGSLERDQQIASYDMLRDRVISAVSEMFPNCVVETVHILCWKRSLEDEFIRFDGSRCKPPYRQFRGIVGFDWLLLRIEAVRVVILPEPSLQGIF